MPQPMTGVLVLIASPGDAAEERSAVRDGLNDWNVTRGRREQVAFLPWMWERHAVPRVGGRPQALINAQSVDQADVVIAFFDSRLGTSTGIDVSGTAEEINRAVDMRKFVHVYFSEEPLPRDVDPDQLAALQVFKANLQERGLLGSYSDPQDLMGQVLRAMESDLVEGGWGGPVSTSLSAPTGAVLHWEHRHESEPKGLDKRGKMNYRTIVNDLVVRNDGSVAAEDVTFEVSPVGDTGFAFPDGPTEPFTLEPKSEMAWLLVPTPSMGTSGRTVEVIATWHENGIKRTERRTVVLHRG